MSPVLLASWNHHLEQAGERAHLTFGHMAEDDQDKKAEHHQDVQANREPGPVEQSGVL